MRMDEDGRNEINGSDLDNYITGNYGNDHEGGDDLEDLLDRIERLKQENIVLKSTISAVKGFLDKLDV